MAGTCVDNAGKSVTVASAPFAYDADAAHADRHRQTRATRASR